VSLSSPTEHHELLAERLFDVAAARHEDAVRQVFRERLPRALRWAVDHPRVLRVAYRLRPAWSPPITYGFDGFGGAVVVAVGARDGTFVIVDSSLVGSA
jgi:hypothetical protein